MPRYAPRMSQEDLRRMIVDRAIENDYVENYGGHDPAAPDMTRMVSMLLSEDIMGEVQKDWSKIDFSTENMDVVADRVTSDGVPYLRIRAGGDWETPLACIIYFDGRKLRGYVPKDGNTYNHAAKAAFGNNDGDLAAFARQFGRPSDSDEYCDGDPDIALIEKDIDRRIEAKGSHSHAKGSVVSKARVKAQRQAVIEKDQDLSGPITADMVYAVISLAAGASYVTFELRSSRREITIDEGNRLVGVPPTLDKTITTYSRTVLWYSPSGCYPMRTQQILEAAGFVKAPDNDISMYAGARTIVIRR